MAWESHPGTILIYMFESPISRIVVAHLNTRKSQQPVSHAYTPLFVGNFKRCTALVYLSLKPKLQSRRTAHASPHICMKNQPTDIDWHDRASSMPCTMSTIVAPHSHLQAQKSDKHSDEHWAFTRKKIKTQQTQPILKRSTQPITATAVWKWFGQAIHSNNDDDISIAHGRHWLRTATT